MDEQELLTQLVGWFESWEQSTSSNRTERVRDRDYYDGNQWTAGEIATLKKRKQPVVTYNRIAPKINSLKGLEASRRAEPRAFPRNVPNDDQGASAATDALKYVLDDQMWSDICENAFDNHAIEGHVGIDVGVKRKTYQDREEMCVTLSWIPWDRCWGDEHSRKPDWSDATYKGQFIWMDLKAAQEKWPTRSDILELTANQSEGSSQTMDDIPRTKWHDPRRKRVRVVECYFYQSGKWYFAQYTRLGILDVMESPFMDEDGQSQCNFEFSSLFIDKDGGRYGMVKNWISVQDEINKRRSKAMHLLNSNRVQMEKGTVDDVNRMKSELAKPDGVVETRPGKKIELLDNLELADAHQQLGQEAKQEIDAVGVNAALAGTERRVMSGRALEQRSEQGLNEVGPVFSRWESFKMRVYRKVWNAIKQFWTAEKWVRVTDDPKNLQFVGFNVPLTLGEKLLNEFKKNNPDAPPEVIQQAEAQAAGDPQMQQVVGLKNDVGQLDVDIRMGEVPASASLQGEQFDRLAEIAPNAGNMPPALFEALVEASSLRNKDRILATLRGEGQKGPSQKEQQLMAQVEELSAQVESNDLKSQQEQLDAQRKLMEMEKRAITAELAAASKDLQLEREKLAAAQKQLAATIAATQESAVTSE